MSEIHNKPILILMGPTASGKSALGISIAKRVGGAIINADAMQCYADLSIITARPSQSDMAQAPHHLYGVWPARTLGNAAMWQQGAVAAIHAAHANGQVPLVLGGTGMYLKGLIDGLSAVPSISQEVKDQVFNLSCRLYDGIRPTGRTSNEGQTPSSDGVTELYHALQQHDSIMAAKLKPNDSQRIGRALEVVLQTGRSLLEWQAEQAPAPFAKEQCRFMVLDIPREVLYARIDARFEQMMAAGALEEVAALKAQFTPEEIAQQRFPLLKAHGVPELMAHLGGAMTLADAIAAGQQNTRNYAKRQLTWLRGQVAGATLVPYDVDAAALELRF